MPVTQIKKLPQNLHFRKAFTQVTHTTPLSQLSFYFLTLSLFEKIREFYACKQDDVLT
jgi:hypothetical protein